MNYEDRPFLRGLQKFVERDSISLHVPGHKGGTLSGLPTDIQSALRYDLTELEGLDDLHEPDGIIKEAQNRLAALYGSTKSYFLVNGSTVGNLAMIYAVCSAGDTVIVQRNAHKSIINGLELTGAQPVFITPPWDEAVCAAGVVELEQIEMALTQFPHAKAVILTYPTYYGSVGQGLQKVIKRCHERDIPVLVDEAHGAHFVVGEPFPSSALTLGADIVVQSAHKTLPAMTMASFLHVNSKLISYEVVAHYLQMLQSSSPSYLLMASLDDARAYAELYDEQDKEYFLACRKMFITSLRGILKLQVIEAEDPLKLLLRVPGYSGFQLQKQLEEQAVYVELADTFQVLLVLPLLRKAMAFRFKEITSRIQASVNQLVVTQKTIEMCELPLVNEEISQLTYTAGSLKKMKKIWLPYDQVSGRIAAATVTPYPPGIPLIIAGEKITNQHVQVINRLTKMGAKFQGEICLNEGQLLVVKQEMEE